MRPLTGSDAQVLDLLHRVVEIGRHRKSFKAHDCVRVAYEHLPHGHVLERKLLAERRRAEKAEAEVQRLRGLLAEARVQPATLTVVPDTELPPRKVIEVGRSAFECFAMYAEGEHRQDIARELGLAPGTVSNHVTRVAGLIGAEPDKAAAMVNRGVIALRPTTKRRAA